MHVSHVMSNSCTGVHVTTRDKGTQKTIGYWVDSDLVIK
jgi:hypothetical protein